MRQNIIITLCIAALFSAVGCSKVVDPATGCVTFKLMNETEVIDITKSSVADFTSLPTAESFSIKVTDSQGNETAVEDISSSISLVAGNYRAGASFGSVSEEGFDKPCFSGYSDFTVNGGATVPVTINVKLANCIVRIATTEAFRNYFTDYDFTVTTGAGTAIAFPKSETRAAFVDAYLIKVKGTLTNQAGKTQTFNEVEYKNLAAASCYTVTFDVSNVGSTAISITFNDSVEDVALLDVELND